MDTKHLDDEFEENVNSSDKAEAAADVRDEADKSADVSHISSFHKLQRGFTGVFVHLGLSAAKVLARISLTLIKGIELLFTELRDLILALLKGIWKLIKFMFSPFKKRMKLTAGMQRSLRKAKKEGRNAYAKELFKCVCKFLFDEDGMVYTAFNYILPIVSIAFFVAVVRYGSGLEYGLSVECNGKEVGIISAETVYDEAASEVQKRISYTDDAEPIDFSPKFSLRIISDDERISSAGKLADDMLASSNSELIEASGIYIDGEFIGAVRDTEPVEAALADLLINYKADGVVRDVSFKNKIEYADGIYLADSLMTEDEAISLLTSQKQRMGTYVAQKGDSAVVICQKYNMDYSRFKLLNPHIETECREGQIVRVTETESYLPIRYIREMETLSFLDYETIEVETSSLNVGSSAILVKGEKGEKRSSIEITYIDGIERSRKVVKSEITKNPIIEQIGIGTYTARPDSPSTVLMGNGQFGWPVDGGYVSDTFISNRNHKGLDIAAPGGSDIYAAGDGVVVSAGWNSGGYGYFVMIDHLDGYQTVYAHCSGLYVSEGQNVTRGQLIAAIGSTGDSTGNHCHFEVRYLGMCYDPASFLNTVDAFKEDDGKDD
ncbi:MAG: peptidoglycan DD-metalloendopeptidase family protein [Oscillospiraceae bacterium]|nr:peptidoglycan DD-metalloendopeptidase family protein [Oscillospiraceae bacterium]